MKGSVRLAESKSIETHIPASLIVGVSRQPTRQPKETTLITTRRRSVTHDLSARLACTEQCISASASSIIVLRQSVSAMRKGLIAKKAMICSATSTSASEPGAESQ